MTDLTRYELFMEAAIYLRNEESLIKIESKDDIAAVFEMSALIINKLEPTTEEDEKTLYLTIDEFHEQYKRNKINHKLSDKFTSFIDTALGTKEIEAKEKKISLSYKDLLACVLNAITDYQNKTIENIPFTNAFDRSSSEDQRPQTFLCYAYVDRGLSLALFIYFLMNGGFLYVNWMWSGTNPNGAITKKELEKELKNSSQFLFLRTPRSELRLRGSYTIRQWCSWEIGNFYTKLPDEKYFVSFYDNLKINNDLLDTFRIMKYVHSGRIVS